MELGLREWVESLPDWERDGPGASVGSVSVEAKPSIQRTFSPAPTKACLVALGCLVRVPPVLHVVGSKGKGSVATMAAALLRAHGLQVGLYQSPHLVAREERISVDGAPITDAAYATYLRQVRDCGSAAGCSRFEVETALAIAYFVSCGVDVIVLEAGLGGVQDATHALSADVVALTSVELEHTSVLGETIAGITQQKAGVLAPGTTLVTGTLPAAAERVVTTLVAERMATRWSMGVHLQCLDQRPHEAGSHLVFGWALPGHTQAEAAPMEVALSLLGRHQVDMAGVACLAARALLQVIGAPWMGAAACAALAKVSLPGRLQALPMPGCPVTLVDVAHTPGSVAAALAAWEAHFGARPQSIMLALNRDKPIAAIGVTLASPDTTLLLVPNPGQRSADPAAMRDGLGDLAAPGGQAFAAIETFGDWQAGWARLQALAQPGLVLGSFRLAGALLRHLGTG